MRIILILPEKAMVIGSNKLSINAWSSSKRCNFNNTSLKQYGRKKETMRIILRLFQGSHIIGSQRLAAGADVVHSDQDALRELQDSGDTGQGKAEAVSLVCMSSKHDHNQKHA